MVWLWSLVKIKDAKNDMWVVKENSTKISLDPCPCFFPLDMKPKNKRYKCLEETNV